MRCRCCTLALPRERIAAGEEIDLPTDWLWVGLFVWKACVVYVYWQPVKECATFHVHGRAIAFLLSLISPAGGPVVHFQVKSLLTELSEEELAELDRAEQVFRVQVASFEELHELTRENRETLGEMAGLLGSSVPGASSVDFPNSMEVVDADKLRELDKLVAMAKALGEMTVSATLTSSIVARHRYQD